MMVILIYINKMNIKFKAKENVYLLIGAMQSINNAYLKEKNSDIESLNKKVVEVFCSNLGKSTCAFPISGGSIPLAKRIVTLVTLFC